MSVNGWAAWCAHERWQARLAQRDDDQIIELLAIRLAWEWLLHDQPTKALRSNREWAARWRDYPAVATPVAGGLGPRLDDPAGARAGLPGAADARPGKRCADGGARRRAGGAGGVLHRRALRGVPARARIVQPADRDDRVRRLLRTAGAVHAARHRADPSPTPRPAGTQRCALPTSATRPRWASSLAEAADRQALRARQVWADLRRTASSAFTYVESCGLLYAAPLLQASLSSQADPAPVEQAGLPRFTGEALRHAFRSWSTQDAGRRIALRPAGHRVLHRDGC